MRAGPLMLRYARRLRELEERVGRIERRLDARGKLLQWESAEAIEPLKPLHSGE